MAQANSLALIFSSVGWFVCAFLFLLNAYKMNRSPDRPGRPNKQKQVYTDRTIKSLTANLAFSALIILFGSLTYVL